MSSYLLRVPQPPGWDGVEALVEDVMVRIVSSCRFRVDHSLEDHVTVM